MAIKYPEKMTDDYAHDHRLAFIKEQADLIFKPERQLVEEYEEFHYETPSDNRFIVCVLIGVFVLMSLYLVNTSAVAGDCTMPATPLSIIGAA